MKIIYYIEQNEVECISPVTNLYSVVFSRFTEDKVEKCCIETINFKPSTYDVQQIIANAARDYAKSDVIKAITIKHNDVEVKGWLDSDARASLINVINAKKVLGETTITIWFDSTPVEMNCDDALKLISTIEVYSSNCFNVTQTKVEEILATTNPDELFAYNILNGYPTNPIFIL